MTNEILDAANLYALGLKDVEKRRAEWLEKYKEIASRLKEIATVLNEKADYKPGYFVDLNHAYNEEMNGTCAKIPSVTFRSGTMPMNVSFRSASEKKEYTENGFHITFMPTITGQVVVLLLPHTSSLDSEKPEEVNLAVIDNPASVTMNDVDQIIYKAIKMAFYTSFTGMVELQEEQMHRSSQPKYTPIGFKRYDSTEKVK